MRRDVLLLCTILACTLLIYMLLAHNGVEAYSTRKYCLQLEMCNIEDSLSLNGSEDCQKDLQSRYESILHELYKDNCVELADKLAYLSIHNESIGNYSEAIRLNIEALGCIEKVLGRNSPDYAVGLSNLASYYSAIGNYLEAIRLETEALNIYDKTLGKEHQDYGASLCNLALYYHYIGDDSEAIKLSNDALIVYENVLGKEHLEYARCLNQSSIYYSNIGDYLEAIKLVTEALKIRERILGKEHQYYGTSLHNLALYYHCIGDYSEAIRLNTEVLNITENILGKEHRDYVKTLLNLAWDYSAVGDDLEAIRLCTDALNICEKVCGKEHPDYANCLHSLALLYSSIRNDSVAIKLDTEALNIRKRVLGKEHPDYALNLESIFTLNISSDIESAVKYLKECFAVKSSIINRLFSGLTSYERISLWNQEGYFFTETMPIWCYLLKDYNLTGYAYDGSLISKNILLNTDIEFVSLLKESGDKDIEELYSYLLTKKQFINRLYEIPIAERNVDVESVEKEVQTLERKLIEKSKFYGNFTHNFSINWNHVQKSLGKDDVAIEFLSFPIYEDLIIYCALTLKKGYEYPRMTMLFDAQQLLEIVNEDYLRGTAIYDLVWRPLNEELEGVKNVYFAPTGELCNIAIESVKDADGEGYVFDKWNIYRLSSTRELALKGIEEGNPQIALFGGITYDSVEMVYDRIERTYSYRYAIEHSLPDSIGLRAGYNYLNGTLKEVIYIDSLYSNMGITTQLYTGITGSETSLKRLSGKRLSNLHISTHGFYWSENEVKTNRSLSGLGFIQRDERPKRAEEKAMTHSGLLFAGANALLNGDTIPESSDDGILTALEVASLDLRGLDLVVLSACQTGLGELKGDGVFGLQRGFKKAGVKTIVMSLWDVDDAATQMLMTEFYKNLLDGKTKRESLLEAQRKVRNFKGVIDGEGRDFSNPKYWAGFIMLDGIE